MLEFARNQNFGRSNMTDNGYLMQYFLEHSPKDSDDQKNLKKTALKEKENVLSKKIKDAGHE